MLLFIIWGPRKEKFNQPNCNGSDFVNNYDGYLFQYLWWGSGQMDIFRPFQAK